ncbi:hypothetical protein BU15DRAFT_43299 [Melanogaster broomeanus]|nr:hypothetical protein BU15DRAFT_43299 [Melanogaster broomeanus]
MLVQQLPVLPQTIPMSQIITADASLLSPISPGEMTWDQQRTPYSADTMDAIGWGYYSLPPSPPASVSSNTTDSPMPPAKIPGSRLTPESLSESEPRNCLPTRQVFELPEGGDAPSSCSSASPTPSTHCQLTLSTDSGEPSVKRSFPSTIGGVKKVRGSGERITTKDFVPPDVTGLSKREARLVKNRAAAFLSRQRKREEFEAMEIRVAELEEEILRLQAAAEKGNSYDEMHEQLRSCLLAAEKRERELTMELANRSVPNTPVKAESHDNSLPSAPYPPYTSNGPNSSATLGLMALLCALPSLQSLPSQSPLPVTISVPLPNSTATRTSTPVFCHQSISTDAKEHERQQYAHGGIGFNSSSTDVDSSRKLAIGSTDASQGQRFDIETLRALGSLAISFDASPTEEGRVRARVHLAERPTNLPAICANKQRSSSLATWAGPDMAFASQSFVSAPQSAPVTVPSPDNLDHLPFMGASNPHNKLCFDSQMMSPPYSSFGYHATEQPFDYYPGFMEQIPEDASKHCARTAWKGMPQINTEGDWEISVS